MDERFIQKLLERLERLEAKVSDLNSAERKPVVAFYNTNTAQTFSTGVLTTLNYEDMIIDTHSAVTVGASWKFTVPLGGYYLVNVSVIIDWTTDFAIGEPLTLRVYNGASYFKVYDFMNISGSVAPAASGMAIVKADVGDELYATLTQGSGATRQLLSSLTYYNFIQIIRL